MLAIRKLHSGVYLYLGCVKMRDMHCAQESELTFDVILVFESLLSSQVYLLCVSEFPTHLRNELINNTIFNTWNGGEALISSTI